MKLLKVTPLIRGVSKDLFYFSQKEAKEGFIASISVRKKKMPALILSSSDIDKNKILLKTLPYALKKISDIKKLSFFTKEFIESANKTAEYFLCGTGNVIKELCPQIILDNPSNNVYRENKNNRANHKISVLQAPYEERLIFYKNLIKTEFAKKNSVFLCLESPKKINQYEKILSKGVEQFVFSFNAEMTKNNLKEKWRKATLSEHPSLVIATRLFLSLPIQNIGTIIIENENSRLYKIKNRPFIDIKKAVENLSIEMKNSLILGDEITSLEIQKRIKEENIEKIKTISLNISSEISFTVVDTKKTICSVSDKLKQIITSNKEKQHTLLFVNRRGYASSTLCGDCGSLFLCPHCDTPLVLHKNKKREFICHKCLMTVPAFDRCRACGSWKAVSFGIGTQKTHDELEKIFPDLKIFRLDSDSVKTIKQGEKIIEDFYNSPSAVLISTELLFSFEYSSFDNVGIVSIDGLFNLPDFNMNERIFQLLMKLKTAARKNFIIQTRLPEHPLFKYVLKSDSRSFYNYELASREKFGYPPFKTLIKITIESKNKLKAESELKQIEKQLDKYNPMKFSAFIPKIKDKYRLYILLKMESKNWPEKEPELREFLFSLQPKWKIEINPESLL
ncbi:MAG: primosomal protein N' [bacterium]|nr:primosomal protein N' [bacterium]